MKNVWRLIIAGVLFFFVQCADVMQVLNQAGIQKPAVKITSTKISALSFEQADLLFDIEIDNPNAIGVRLAGFDYDLFLNDQSFLKGDQQKQMEIRARDKATVQLPLTLNFIDIYNTYQNLKNQDEVNYSLQTGFTFDLPLLGPVRIPVSTSGKVPMVKLPSVSVKSLKLENLSLTAASFDLILGLNNPNSWGVLLNGLNYNLAINGSEWITGQTREKISLGAKGARQITLPFSISFIMIGSSVYDMITGGKVLAYRLQGRADLLPSLELLGGIILPFDVSGKLDISK